MREMNSFKQAYENLFDVSYSTFIDTENGMVRRMNLLRSMLIWEQIL